MLSSTQVVPCLETSTMMNSTHQLLNQTTGYAQAYNVWPQQLSQQPMLLLAPQSSIPQPGSPGVWGIAQQAVVSEALPPQMQLQASVMSQPALMDASGGTAVLQDGNVVMLLPQQVSTPMISTGTMPMVVQVAGCATGQPVLHVPVSGHAQQPQQVVMVHTGQQVLSMDQGASHYGIAAADGSCGSDGGIQLQVQQLQDAVQHLSCDATVVSTVMPTAPMANQAEMCALGAPMTAVAMPDNSPTHAHNFTDAMLALPALPQRACPHQPGQLCTCNSSPTSSVTGNDSLGSSVLGTDSSGANSPYKAHTMSRLGGSHASSGSLGSGPSMLRIMSAPDAPRPSNVMSGPQGLQGAAVQAEAAAGATGVVMLSGSGWPAGSGLIPTAAVDGSGTNSPTVSFLAQPVDQGSAFTPPVFQLQVQPGSHQLPARRSSGHLPGSMQRPLRPYKAGMLPTKTRISATAPRGPAAAAQATPLMGQMSIGAAGAPDGAAAPQKVPQPAGPWALISLEDGLKQLWSSEQLVGAKGGRLFNVQQLAWHPIGEPDPCPQDMYNFQKLKRMVQKLDAVHKTRVKLIKRIHAVADHGEGDLKSVYREVRGLIGEMLHDSVTQIKSLAECRVTGLVRLALMLQEALQLGPRDVDCI